MLFPNIPLAREIYGNVPWAVDGPTFGALARMLQDLRSGVSLSHSGDKANNIFLYDIKSATQIITNSWELNNDFQGDDLIYVVNLNGVVTKNGGASSYGTKTLAQQIIRFDADSRVRGGILYVDSGGGSIAGIPPMEYAFATKTKPVVALVERGGVMASAAYAIGSMADYILAEDETSEVGSIGTMISFAARPHESIGFDGDKQVTLYATKSTKKNLAFENAINSKDYSLLINEVLDPANENLLASVKARRPAIKEDQLDGSDYFAKDVIGTLIDGIGTFEDAVAKVIQLSASSKISNSQNKTKQKTAMTAQELSAQHPAVYQEVFNAGVAAEKDRTGAWLAHAETDLATVTAGISGGEQISATARETLLIKAMNKNSLQAVAKDSPAAIVPPEAKGEPEANAEDKEATDFYSKVMEGMK